MTGERDRSPAKETAIVRLTKLLGMVLGVCAAVLGSPARARCESAPATEAFSWRTLPELPSPASRQPDSKMASPFVGTANDALIVAGGGHVPRTFPGPEAGPQTPAKLWATIYVLEEHGEGKPAVDTKGKPIGQTKYRWIATHFLPEKVAFGASASAGKHGLICIGGWNGEKCLANVSALKWDSEKRQLTIESLPPLPHPRAFAAAAVVGETVYVAGGVESVSDRKPTETFWSLDLSLKGEKSKFVWKTDLPPLPNGPRARPALVAQNAGSGVKLYLIAGRSAKPPRRALPNHMYRFDPKAATWQQVADPPWLPPRPVGVACGEGHVFVFDSRGRVLPGRADKGALAYHTITDTWVEVPAPACRPKPLTAVRWGKTCIFLCPPDGRTPNPPKIWQAQPKRRTGGFGAWNWAALIAYLVAIVCMGVYFSKREKTTEDFFLAGRRVPWWAAGISIFGTSLSAITFMAIPAQAYATNWVFFLGNIVAVLLVPLIVAFYIPFFRRLKVATAYEYLEERFNVFVRIFGSAMFVLFQIGRMTIVLFLPAKALSTVTGINVYTCILMMGLLCTVYTVLGGIEAVIWTDVLQVVILMGAALLCLVLIALGVDGGFGKVVATGLADGKLHAVDMTWDFTTTAIWVVIVGNLFSMLMPLTADQTVVQRYLSTTSERAAGRALWTNALGGIPASILFFGLGTALYVFYKTHPAALDPGVETKAIFPLFIVQQLPPGVCGLVIAGLFAAAMSSIDSSMNSIACVVVNDYYKRFKPGVPDRRCLLLARGITVALGLLAVGTASVTARLNIPSMWEAYLEIFGLFGGSLAALFAMGIFTRRVHATGALIGAGASVVVLYFVKTHTKIHFLLYAAIALVTCFVVGYLASLIIPARRKNLGGLIVYRMIAKTED